MALVLVVEDERELAEVLEGYLRQAGHRTERASDGPSAVAIARRARPDLVLLDVNLPGMDGHDVLRAIRAQGPTPVIFLTARSDEIDRIVGLELGADDYVTKPFSPREVMARVKAVLRRGTLEAPAVGAEPPLRIGPLEVDRTRLEASVDGADLALTVAECRVLWHLAAHREYAGALKDALAPFGVSAFVAHSDIKPTAEWQDEILTALATSDALIALMHKGFKDSDWTDQEVGFAMGRGVPTFAVRFDQTPYGFIGRFQAFNGNGAQPQEMARQIFDALRVHKQTERKMAEVLVARFERSSSFQAAKDNLQLLQDLTYWTQGFSDRVQKAVETNSQVADAWGVPRGVDDLVARWAAKV